MNHFLKIIIPLVFLQFACKSTEKTSATEKSMSGVTEFRIDAVTMGKRESYVVKANTFEYSSYSRGAKSSEEEQTSINKKEWDNLVDFLAEINLKEISKLQAPTDKRMYDGDLATVLKVITKEATYESSTFDKQTPPDEIKSLVKYIYSLQE